MNQMFNNILITGDCTWLIHHMVNLLQVRSAFNKFPDYFLQAFKIVVDS